MPLIGPPKDENNTIQPQVQVDELGLFTKEQYDYIQHYLNVKPWICPTCSATVFGRSLKCYCKTERPKNFVLEPK